MGINIHQQIAELKREKAMRANVYPKMVGRGQLKKSAADYQMECLDQAIASLEYLRDHREVIINAVHPLKAVTL